MPIITVQRRHAEHGRIRLGQKVTGTSKTGKEYTRPAKLDRFRFTSASERLVKEIAAKYGGTTQQWDNDGKPEWEVISDATSLPVIIVKGGFSQWHEHWTRAGLQHRCTGEEGVDGTPCDPDDPAHIEAIKKPTTRLSVMLSEIESLGLWRMESKGWNAAAELPSMAELAMHVGDLVPATLSLAERSAVIETENGPQTSRFVVPVLDLHVTKRRLVELMSGQQEAAELAAPSQPAAIAAPATLPDYAAAAAGVTTVDAVRDIWEQARHAGALTDDLKAYLTARVGALKAGAGGTPSGGGGAPGDSTPPAAAPSTSTDVVDAEVVEDADAVWAAIVKAGGERGMTLPDLEDDFAANMGGLTSDSASAEELDAYLKILTARNVA